MTGRGQDTEALREVLRKTELAGAGRKAVLLHIDRLPPALTKPHHIRLARDALRNLLEADRAQSFELSRGRVAVIWRGRGGDELAQAREALGHLLSDQPAGQTPLLGELLTLYDLPEQAIWLLDELTEPAERPGQAGAPAQSLDLARLARLESSLVQADLSRFTRWRSIMRILPEDVGPPASLPPAPAAATLAWEERYFAVYELAAGLCPDRNVKGDPWLFQRLTRLLDQRMLAALSVPGEFRRGHSFALNLNVMSMLSEEFLRFDRILPMTGRGGVILNLRPADLLADCAAYSFARNFARARGYRLALLAGTAATLRLFDLKALGVDYVQLKLSSELLAQAGAVRDHLPQGVEMVVSGLDRSADVRWAQLQGVGLGLGRAFSL